VENITFLEELVSRYPQLLSIRNEIGKAAECMINCYDKKRKILVCGNGGSSSDSAHIVGELMKEFEQKRPLDLSFKKKLSAISANRGSYLAKNLQQGLPAISLAAHDALITAFANDSDADLVFAQQVVGYGQTGDIIIGISTSGN
jgi:phosphoheptose isomerase